MTKLNFWHFLPPKSQNSSCIKIFFNENVIIKTNFHNVVTDFEKIHFQYAFYFKELEFSLLTNIKNKARERCSINIK